MIPRWWCCCFGVIWTNGVVKRNKTVSIFGGTVELGDKELFCHPKIVPYPYEVNWQLVTGNGSLTPICSLSKRSLSPSLTVPRHSGCFSLATNLLRLPCLQQILAYSFWILLILVTWVKLDEDLRHWQIKPTTRCLSDLGYLNT